MSEPKKSEARKLAEERGITTAAAAERLNKKPIDVGESVAVAKPKEKPAK